MRHVFRRAALGIALVLVPTRVTADGGSERSIILGPECFGALDGTC